MTHPSPSRSRYATGQLPSNYGASAFSAEHDCLYNTPGNEGQEQSLSGSGCRTLIQSMMYGEAAALSELCRAIGDEAGATEMAAEAVILQMSPNLFFGVIELFAPGSVWKLSNVPSNRRSGRPAC